MQQVLPGIHRWSIFDELRQVDFNGWHLRVGDERVLVDPVPMSDDVLAAIVREGAPSLIVITNRDHRRAAPRARDRFGCPVVCHALDAPLMDVPVDRTVDDGEVLAGALRVVHLACQKSPGEMALHWAERRVLILGDALWGKPAGALTMLPDAKYADPAAARRGLQRLAGLDVDALLPGDGAPITTGAGEVLRATLGRLGS